MTEPAAAGAPRRTKSLVVLVGALVALATLIAWTQVWFAVSLDDGARLDVDGQVAAPALSALALTSLVLVGALSIAGPFFRFILGMLESLIGVTVVLSCGIALGDPVRASAPAISVATGVAGGKSVRALVSVVSESPWPWVALVSGALLVVTGLAIIVLGRRWPGSSRKYQAVRLEPADAARNPVDDWDALSGGSDPTTRD
ncbi:MAG: peptidase [Microbacteriaceae bacterium]|nr:peptidase [Microbacteriaceae bacterium]